MGKFEFVSFNKEDHNEEACFGKMVFTYNGIRYKTNAGFINQRTRLDVCHNATWTLQDIDWRSMNVDVSDEDKLLILSMFINNVVPILSKCECCNKPVRIVGELDAFEKEINAYVATKH